MVFGNWVLRRIFGTKRNEVTGGRRKLHNEKLHNLYFSPKCNYTDQVKEDSMGRGEKRNSYKILVGKPEGSKLRRRWVDNIKMDLREIGWDGGDWIDLAQDRDQWTALVKAVMNLRVP
jgi:hypothetical protein